MLTGDRCAVSVLAHERSPEDVASNDVGAGSEPAHGQPFQTAAKAARRFSELTSDWAISESFFSAFP